MRGKAHKRAFEQVKRELHADCGTAYLAALTILRLNWDYKDVKQSDERHSN